MTDEGSNAKRVLVIDDEPRARAVICEYLQMSGYRADAAGSVQEAVQLFCDTPYDLITLDFRMPGMDGGQLHQFLSKHFGHGQRVSDLLPQRLPPILIVTGCAHDPAVQALLDGENVIEIIEKPISYESFSLAVTHVLARAEQRRLHRRKLRARLAKHIVSNSRAANPG